MDRKILAAFLLIGLASAIAGASLYAYFSDVETSNGNKFTAGWLDLKLAHPPGKVEETVNLHVSGVSINSVVLKFEWQRAESIDGARLRIRCDHDWKTYNLSLPTAGTDDIVTINLKTLYGIDTAKEINALKIQFQAKGKDDAYTWHDWVEVQVTYTELPSSITKTIYLNPNEGEDKTDSHKLNQTDLNLLKTSDDNRYRSYNTWKKDFKEDEYIQFEFEDIAIPDGATIDSVKLMFEWQRPGTVDDARLKIFVGTSLIGTISLEPLPQPDTDRTEVIDLKDLGIDTETEINALKIWFQAKDGKGAYTLHDWVEVEVKYTISPSPNWQDGVSGTFSMTNMKPGDSATGKILLKYEGSITASSLKITCDYSVTDPPGPESDTQEDTPPDHMAEAFVITTLKYSGVDRLGDLYDHNGDGIKTLYDLKHSGLTVQAPNPYEVKEFVITVRFDPDATRLNANDFQGDTLNLTIVFTLEQ